MKLCYRGVPYEPTRFSQSTQPQLVRVAPITLTYRGSQYKLHRQDHQSFQTQSRFYKTSTTKHRLVYRGATYTLSY